MRLPPLPLIAALAVSGAAFAADPARQPPPWASAGDETGRSVDSRTTAAPQQPNASSRGAATSPAPRTASSQSVQPQAAQDASASAQTGQAEPAHSKRSGASTTHRPRAANVTPSPAKTTQTADDGQSNRTASAAAGGSAARSEPVADTTVTPVRGETAYTTSEDYVRRARDWGWLGLLGLIGLLGLVRRRHYERDDTVVTQPADEPVRGVRVYETPNPAPRP